MRTERGNILFLILLAIILFAALSFAIMSQREQAPASMHKEQANSLSAALIQEAGLLEQNVMRAKMMDGVQDYGFDFAGPNTTSSTNNTCSAMPDPKVCRMTRNARSGLMEMPAWSYTGSYTEAYARFMVIQIANVGTPLDELVYVRAYLRREICEAINRGLGITDINLALNDAISGGGTRNYDGTLTSIPDNSGAQLGEPSSGVPGVAGRTSFCVNNQSWGYMFVHVLIAR